MLYISPFFVSNHIFFAFQHTGRNDRGFSFGSVATWPWSAEAKGHIWKEAAKAGQVMKRRWRKHQKMNEKDEKIAFVQGKRVYTTNWKDPPSD